MSTYSNSQLPSSTALYEVEVAVEAAAEAASIIGIDVDDFAALAKGKLIEVYIVMAKKKICEQEKIIAQLEKKRESLKKETRGCSNDEA